MKREIEKCHSILFVPWIKLYAVKKWLIKKCIIIFLLTKITIHLNYSEYLLKLITSKDSSFC